MFCFIPVTGAKQKLGEEKLLKNWTLVCTTLKLNAIITIYLNYLVIFKHFNNAIKPHCLLNKLYIYLLLYFALVHISS